MTICYNALWTSNPTRTGRAQNVHRFLAEQENAAYDSYDLSHFKESRAGTSMKRIDARTWDRAVTRQLENAVAEGGAELEISDNSRVVVIDAHLWKLLAQRLPSISEIFENIRSIKSEGEDET
jgi:hypothetical protein